MLSFLYDRISSVESDHNMECIACTQWWWHTHTHTHSSTTLPHSRALMTFCFRLVASVIPFFLGFYRVFSHTNTYCLCCDAVAVLLRLCLYFSWMQFIKVCLYFASILIRCVNINKNGINLASSYIKVAHNGDRKMQKWNYHWLGLYGLFMSCTIIWNGNSSAKRIFCALKWVYTIC